MNYIIVDTNIPLKAADVHPCDEIDRCCSLSCLSFLNKLMDADDESIVVLDMGREILNEYQKNIDTHSEDNVASLFLMWIFHNINMGTGRVEQCKITKKGNTYVEFPDSANLKNFDLSDRKFVALAREHPGNPDIYDGSDTDWWDFRDALESEGVHVVFLCEDYMRAKSKEGRH